MAKKVVNKKEDKLNLDTILFNCRDILRQAKNQIISELSYSYADLMKAYLAGHVRLLKAIAKLKYILQNGYYTL